MVSNHWLAHHLFYLQSLGSRLQGPNSRVYRKRFTERVTLIIKVIGNYKALSGMVRSISLIFVPFLNLASNFWPSDSALRNLEHLVYCRQLKVRTFKNTWTKLEGFFLNKKSFAMVKNDYRNVSKFFYSELVFIIFQLTSTINRLLWKHRSLDMK